MQKEENNFPRYIDKPRLIGIFEIDEFFLAFGLMAAILASSLALPQLDSMYVMLIAISTGIGSAVGYKKFKKGRPDGYTMQKFYRKGLFSPYDDKKGQLIHKHLSKIGRVIPYGFTRVFYN